LSTILTTRKLNFSWGPRHVLRDIDMSIDQNELVAVLGVNGAGKSTLLKCINQILKPDSGSISICDRDVEQLNLVELSRQISYVPQSIRASFSLDVFDVVLLGRRPHISWRIGSDDRDKVSETLQFFDLEEFAFRRFDQLSGGERQRVIIAKALAQNPVLLVMDEPTSDLDLKNQIEVMKRIKEWIADESRNVSALIAIHDINTAARFANRILLLHEGNVFADGEPKTVLTKDNIATVFSVSCEIMDESTSSPLRVIVKDEISSDEEE